MGVRPGLAGREAEAEPVYREALAVHLPQYASAVRHYAGELPP